MGVRSNQGCPCKPYIKVSDTRPMEKQFSGVGCCSILASLIPPQMRITGLQYLRTLQGISSGKHVRPAAPEMEIMYLS